MQIQSLAQYSPPQPQHQANFASPKAFGAAQDSVHFSGNLSPRGGLISTLLIAMMLLVGCGRSGSSATSSTTSNAPVASTAVPAATVAPTASSFNYVELIVLPKSAEVQSMPGLVSSQAGCPLDGAVVDVTTDLRGSYEKAINEALACGKRDGTITDQSASIQPAHWDIFNVVFVPQMQSGDRLWVSREFATNPTSLYPVNGFIGSPVAQLYR